MTQNKGACRDGVQSCVDGVFGPCTGEITPSMELCDGMDYDCNGMPNTGCGCVVGTTRGCYDGPTGTSGVGHEYLNSLGFVRTEILFL